MGRQMTPYVARVSFGVCEPHLVFAAFRHAHLLLCDVVQARSSSAKDHDPCSSQCFFFFSCGSLILVVLQWIPALYHIMTVTISRHFYYYYNYFYWCGIANIVTSLFGLLQNHKQ